MSSPRTWHQLGIFLLDGSGSMERDGKSGRPLAHDANHALQSFLAWFKTGSKVNNFSISVITFGEQAEEHTPPTPLDQVDEQADYNPLTNHGDRTDIGAALEKAEAIANAHFNQPDAQANMPHTVHIIIMTDGLCLNAEHTRQVAARLRQTRGVELFCTLFIPPISIADTEVQLAKELMREVVGDDKRFRMSYDEPTLRKFFKESMSTNVALAPRTVPEQ